VAEPLVGLVVGSKTDWDVLSAAADALDVMQVPYERKLVSAHRTPLTLLNYGRSAEDNGLKVLIAAAGGAAHLPGMLASLTNLPVIGVPVPSTRLNGVDSLLSIVQMPAGTPVATMAIGRPGAINAAILAVSILAHFSHNFWHVLFDYKAALNKEASEGFGG
jgi:5-(carboxyamino)imidazole ribonucleotide mutase